jgi:hypothetical protein
MNSILLAMALTCSADPAEIDAAWHAKPSVTTAINRGRTHWLAGNVPEAIRAFREGERLAPWNAVIRADLDAARDVLGTTAPAPTFADRVGPADVWMVAILSSLAVGVGGTAWLLTRRNKLLIVAGGGVAGWIALVVVTFLATNRTEPFAIVAVEGAQFRTGNAVSYDLQSSDPLPLGTEVTVLGRRGGWVRASAPAGLAGWLPESAVLFGESP